MGPNELRIEDVQEPAEVDLAQLLCFDDEDEAERIERWELGLQPAHLLGDRWED